MATPRPSFNQRTGKPGDWMLGPEAPKGTSKVLHSVARGSSKSAAAATADANRKRGRDQATGLMNASTLTPRPAPPAYTPVNAPVNNPVRPTGIAPPVALSPSGPGYDVSAASALPGGSFTGASTGGTGGTGGLTAPLTGLAGSFDPALLQYVYAQPELILKQLMTNNGQLPLTRNSGLFTAGTPYMDALMTILPLAFGGNGQPDSSSAINWLGQQMQSGMTPGGQGINFGGVLDAARSQLGDPSSAAAQYYNAPGMDPLDQISKMKELVLGAGSMGLAPQFQTALKNALNTASLNYMSQFTTGQNSQNFAPWFLNSDYLNGY
jgi:hypothetical protein